jgi:hypothetical protein
MNADGDFLKEQTVNLRNEATNRHWSVDSYGEGSVNSDPYYRENLVIGDLPAGLYTVWTNHDGRISKVELVIRPGMVTNFNFWGNDGFELSPPSESATGFIPPDATSTPTP